MSDWQNVLAPKTVGKGHDYSKQHIDALRERVVTLERFALEAKDMLSENFIMAELALKRVQIVEEALAQQTEVMALMMAELEAK